MELLTEVINKISDNSHAYEHDVSEIINKELTEILDQMMLQTEDISAAMISSIDGIAWAERLEKGFDQHRFAAMSSALLALSDNRFIFWLNGSSSSASSSAPTYLPGVST